MLDMQCYVNVVLRACCTCGAMYVWCCVYNCISGVVCIWCCVHVIHMALCVGGALYMSCM